uniref:Uncharacterized protein n=1 Tax=Rhodnius prolixus TaxID=13249 RepID=T1HUI7_RHOPR
MSKIDITFSKFLFTNLFGFVCAAGSPNFIVCAALLSVIFECQ